MLSIGCGVHEEADWKRVIWKELIKTGKRKRGKLLHHLFFMCQARKTYWPYLCHNRIHPTCRGVLPVLSPASSHHLVTLHNAEVNPSLSQFPHKWSHVFKYAWDWSTWTSSQAKADAQYSIGVRLVFLRQPEIAHCPANMPPLLYISLSTICSYCGSDQNSSYSK